MIEAMNEGRYREHIDRCWQEAERCGMNGVIHLARELVEGGYVEILFRPTTDGMSESYQRAYQRFEVYAYAPGGIYKRCDSLDLTDEEPPYDWKQIVRQMIDEVGGYARNNLWKPLCKPTRAPLEQPLGALEQPLGALDL